MAQTDTTTILVVEDEPLIRMDAVGFLEDAGFVCLEASSVASASDVLDAHPEIQILFTDIEIDGPSSGIDLAQDAHRRFPHLRLLITSGRICPAPGTLPPGSIFLPKPYRPDAVTQVMRSGPVRAAGPARAA